MDSDTKIAWAFILFWVFGIVLSLGTLGLLIWGFIRLVLKYT